MLTAETAHAEGPRYAAALVCIPGFWAGPVVWRGFASYLGHRGWESHLLDVRGVAGGTGARAGAVVDYVGELATPPILVAHDAGALVALAAAAARPPAALVLVAPVPPGHPGVRVLVRAPRSLLALVLGRPVPPPGEAADADWLDLPEPLRSRTRATLGPEDAVAVRDLVWNRVDPRPPAGIPILVVSGADDHLLPPAAAATEAARLGGELQILPHAGHWVPTGPRWKEAVGLVHRWLVQRLGEPLLELHAEAMADRAEDEDAD